MSIEDYAEAARQRLAAASYAVCQAADAYVVAKAREGVPQATERAAYERLRDAVAARRECR